MEKYNLVIIGAGICGLTAAYSAASEGIDKILVLEKEEDEGGICNQFIHTGFGKDIIGEEVTAPEFVDFVKHKVSEYSDAVTVKINSNVLSINEKKEIEYVNPEEGIKKVCAEAVILATGIKERYIKDISISTNYITGIFTIGEAQKIINLDGFMPGKAPVIMAKNKWSFLLARRLVLEGAEIKGIILEKSFEDVKTEEIEDIMIGMEFPIYEYSEITRINSNSRIESVIVKNLKNSAEEEISCDSLLITMDMQADLKTLEKLPLKLQEKDNLVEVNEKYETSIDGIFACGGIIYGKEIMNKKDISGIECGIQAGKYIKNKK